MIRIKLSEEERNLLNQYRNKRNSGLSERCFYGSLVFCGVAKNKSEVFYNNFSPSGFSEFTTPQITKEPKFLHTDLFPTSDNSQYPYPVITVRCYYCYKDMSNGDFRRLTGV
ncbi:MAG: hypothetical protein HC887_09735 [Desulfobacteraceae bacterium]|nr:hypothetical protein [Desulfobacteraceae bacterium]